MKIKSFLLGCGFSLSLSVMGCGSQDPSLFNTYGVHKGAGSVGIHTVLQGDTVYSIAKNYQLPMREIITLNNIQAPYALNTGYRMKLPPPNEYKVREGDSVSTIARMYEVSPNRLASLNDLSSPFRLSPGQVLRLPSPSGQYEGAQQAVVTNNLSAQPTTQTARLDPVEKEDLNPKSKTVDAQKKADSPAKKTTTTSQKPSVQKASATRAKLSKATPKMSGNGKFMRPVDGKIISSYGPKKDGLHNDGINIKAVRGAPVRAAENGIVVYNGNDLEGYGNLVLIRHENKMMSAYAHLDKTLIKRGAKVVRGQSIGTVGSTGQVDSPQLHFEIRRGSTPLNPTKYL